MSLLMLLLYRVLAASLCEAMKKRRETPIVQDIGDVMLASVSGITHRIHPPSLYLHSHLQGVYVHAYCMFSMLTVVCVSSLRVQLETSFRNKRLSCAASNLWSSSRTNNAKTLASLTLSRYAHA